MPSLLSKIVVDVAGYRHRIYIYENDIIHSASDSHLEESIHLYIFSENMRRLSYLLDILDLCVNVLPGSLFNGICIADSLWRAFH